jgi:ABC-2 type transport system ATP-binding protein
MRNLILRLKTEQHKTIVFSSHNLAEVEILCNRMVIIHQGKNIVEGSVQELLNEQEQVIRVQTDESYLAPAFALVQAFQKASQFKKLGLDGFEVSMAKSDIPAFNQALVTARIPVYSVETKRKLEDYFINLLQA